MNSWVALHCSIVKQIGGQTYNVRLAPPLVWEGSGVKLQDSICQLQIKTAPFLMVFHFKSALLIFGSFELSIEG
jgi:hypothetical protein